MLCRVYRDHKKVEEAISILEQLGFERVGLGHELLGLASRIAIKDKLSGYDSVYVATAQLLGGKWYTFDNVAHRKIERLKRSTVLL